MNRPAIPFRASAFAAALVLGTVPAAAFAATSVKLGGNFPATTFTAGQQRHPDVAKNALGNFVVVWESQGQDGSGFGIFGQRFAVDGRKLGAEFLVDTLTAGNQSDPRVAMDAAGDFVVVWAGPDTSDLGVHARLFAADGTPRGAQFRVNPDTTGTQTQPDVAMDATGGFAVTWENFVGAADADVFVRRYDAAGVALDNGVRVNAAASGDQTGPSVAMDADGDLVVAWESVRHTAGTYTFDVEYRRFSSAGAARDATDQRVATTGNTFGPSAAMDATGDFVIAWHNEYFDALPHSYSIYARRYTADGAPIDAQPVVFATSAVPKVPRGLAMSATGEVVAAWDVFQGASSNVVFRMLAPDGSFRSGVLQANATPTGVHSAPMAAMDADGDFVVAWQVGTGTYSGNYDVLAQRFRNLEEIDLSVVQTDDPDWVKASNELHYTLDVANLTPPSTLDVPDGVRSAIGVANGVTLTDTLAAGTTFLSATGSGWTCTFASPDVTCRTRSPLAAGESMKPLTIAVTAPASPGTIVNHAVVSADQVDPDPANSTSDEPTLVRSCPDSRIRIASRSVATVAEGAGSVEIVVERVGGSCGPAEVSYTTANGTAHAGKDFTEAHGTLHWNDFELGEKIVTVAVRNDTRDEADEIFRVRLHDPVNAVVGHPANRPITILDDDEPPPPP